MLTKPQRARLEKLAAYLEGLPKRYRHFDMASFVRGKNDDKAIADYALKNGGVTKCGTVACAIGHGPDAGILVPPRFVSYDRTWDEWEVDWSGYAVLFIGPDPAGEGHPHEGLFDWLFESDWADVDNHHLGAAARIRYLLDRGAPPEGFEEAKRRWRKFYAPYRIDAPSDIGRDRI